MVISTLADVTFYGQDQTGRAVSVTGTIGVNFADWADPDTKRRRSQGANFLFATAQGAAVASQGRGYADHTRTHE